MPLTCKKHGIAFQYPDNWTIDEADSLADCKSVTVYSPGGAFWSIMLSPCSRDPHSFSKVAIEAMREEYEELDIEEIEETIAGRLMSGYDMHFYCLDLTNTACVRSVGTDQATYTVFYQAEDREFDRLHPVFLAITNSLLNSLNELN